MTDATPRPRALSRRRRENASGARTKRHSVYVTPEEAGRLARLAEARHMTVPRLLIEAALASETGQTESERRELLTLLFNLHRALGAIGNNVNQLTKVANATGELSAELHGTLDAVRRALVRLDDAMEEVELP
ncbi:plasmid mobilization protein [Antribacter gilvus]|uniref:plasmid mobilization protein n=1 Tax=Antribacter gilvus TaxID=2304675 RepID=UPI000F7679AC|nr:plasmid mobilization relaxosome protein MobC [Antribacter gilvus]